jgi:hypothetical protein
MKAPFFAGDYTPRGNGAGSGKTLRSVLKLRCSLRVLQFLPDTQDATRDARNGSWDYRSRLDVAGVAGLVGMTERQIDRIRKAEEAICELVQVAAQLRKEVENLPITDADCRAELLEAAEEYERQAHGLRDALRRWREDIH